MFKFYKQLSWEFCAVAGQWEKQYELFPICRNDSRIVETIIKMCDLGRSKSRTLRYCYLFLPEMCPVASRFIGRPRAVLWCRCDFVVPGRLKRRMWGQVYYTCCRLIFGRCVIRIKAGSCFPSVAPGKYVVSTSTIVLPPHVLSCLSVTLPFD